MASAATPTKVVPTTVATIATHPGIQDPLSALRQAKTYERALAAIGQMISSWSCIEGLSPLCESRVRYIANHMSESLEEHKCCSTSEKVLAIGVEMLNLQNALQIEAFAVGSFAPFIESYSGLIASEEDEILWERLPLIIEQVTLDPETACFQIDCTIIESYFYSVDFNVSNTLLDSIILTYFRNAQIQDGKFFIPYDLRIDPSLLRSLMQKEEVKSNPQALHIIQLLYVCYMENSGVLPLKDMTSFTIEILGKPQSSGRLLFDEYLCKEKLVPLLGYFIKKRHSCLAEGRDFKRSFLSPKTICEFASIANFKEFKASGSPHWLEDAAEAYMLVLQIHLYCKQLLRSTPALYAQLNRLKDKAADPQLLRSMEILISKRTPGHQKYPLSVENPFCTSKEDFMLIPFYRICEVWKNQMMSSDKAVSTKVVETKGRTSKKKPLQLVADDAFVSVVAVTKKPSSSKGKKVPDLGQVRIDPVELAAIADGTAVSTAVPPSILTMDLSFSPAAAGGAGGAAGGAAAAGGAGVGAAAGISPPVSFSRLTSSRSEDLLHADYSVDAIHTSLTNAKTFLGSLHFHLRVVSWFTSAEAGLKYYGFDDPRNPQTLSREEMTLRHRFPPQLLLLAFNPLFAKQSKVPTPDGRIVTQWKSILLIDGKKYLLEASADEENCVFHLYAKPVTNFFDYFKRTPVLAERLSSPTAKAATPHSTIETDEGGISFDSRGNASIEIDGRSIIVIAL